MKKWLFISLSILAVIGIVFNTWANSIMLQGKEPKANGTNEYAILLGAKVKKNGEPSLALRYRLEETVKYMETYPHVTVIVSGGKGVDEPMSEAERMYTYLIEAGIEKERIILEDQATSTYENLLYSKELLPEEINKVTIITSDFHLARAKLLAEKLGLEADVVAAETPEVVEEKLRAREKIALAKTYLMGK